MTLFSRAYCHLCHEMESALQRMASEFVFDLEIVDIDENPVLLERYDERVPVLVYQGVELCHYFLDDAKVRDLLSKIG